MCPAKAMRVVKCFSLESMATEMLHEARDLELQAQCYKRKATRDTRDTGAKSSAEVRFVRTIWGFFTFWKNVCIQGIEKNVALSVETCAFTGYLLDT